MEIAEPRPRFIGGARDDRKGKVALNDDGVTHNDKRLCYFSILSGLGIMP